ncbi:AAA family ATPase [Micromonospora sp. LOL_024]|uniref:AAA family ATPase n=1 Tax=Micromonospora sp. LOL_024 TaxID=3345412 RepID=UPI003A8AD29B
MTREASRTERLSPGSPILVVLRGNSASGKTTTAREVRRRFGRGLALLEQDYLRRTILREHDSANIDPVAPTFITATARTALDLGYHVILEGILHTERYADALHQLIDHHPGPTAVFYLDVSVRHEALHYRVEVRELHRRPVAAGW